jgi:DNA-directed RNA polymerase subunit M
MEFCPKCGAVLIQKRKNDGCIRCNYSSKSRVKIKTSEKFDEKREVAVIRDKDVEIYPIIQTECKKCGHDKVYFWTMQTRATDEAETKFFKCTKCEFTWREYR